MARYKLALSSLIMAIVVASCGVELQYDWCFLYSFATPDIDHPVNIVSGERTNAGIESTDGLIQFNYDLGRFIELRGVEFSVLKQIEDIGTPFDVTAAGNVYGVSTSFTAPFVEDFAIIIIEQSNIGTQGSTINVTIDSGEYDIILSTMQLFAGGVESLGRDDCSGGPPPTMTPTETPITATPTPTETATPTPTPDTTPIYLYNQNWRNQTHTTNGFLSDSLVDDGDYVISHSFTCDGVEQATSGYHIYDGRSLTSSFTNPTYYVGWGGALGVTCHTINTIEFDLSAFGRFVPTTVQIWGAVGEGGGAASSQFWGRYRLYDDNTQVATSLVNRSTGIPQRFTLGFGTNGQAGDRIQITNSHRSSNVRNWIYHIQIAGYWVEYNPPQMTSTPTPLPTVGVGDPTRTPIGFDLWTATPEPPEETEEPEPTNTPDLTAQWTAIPSATPFVSQITPDPEDPFDYDAENEPEWEILSSINDFFNWTQNSIANLFGFFGDAFGWLGATIGNLFSFIADFFNWIIGFINAILNLLWEVLEIIWLVIQLILGLINLLVQWVRQMIERLVALVVTFFTIPASPIPFLPQCASDPLNHSICAVYWAMEWTLFADGSLGQFIIPLGLAVMNILIVFRFAIYVLRIVRKGSRVSD